MANWSDCTIHLQAQNTFELAKVKEVIEKDKLNNALPLDVLLLDTCASLNSIVIEGSGRWSVEADYFIRLADTHKLSGTFVDFESGSNFFHHIEFDLGDIKSSILTGYYSKEHAEYLQDPAYFLESLDWIFESPDWEEQFPEEVNFLLSLGYTIEELKGGVR